MKKYMKPIIISSDEMSEKTQSDVVAVIPFVAAAAAAAVAVAKAVEAFDDKDLNQKVQSIRIRKVG